MEVAAAAAGAGGEPSLKKSCDFCIRRRRHCDGFSEEKGLQRCRYGVVLGEGATAMQVWDCLGLCSPPLSFGGSQGSVCTQLSYGAEKMAQVNLRRYLMVAPRRRMESSRQK